MDVKDQSWLKISSIYVGTVIGAGFASGQEIMNFFGKFGFKGLIGICISGVLFSFMGCFILSMVYKYKINSYHALLSHFFGKKMSTAIDLIVLLFLLAGYCIMLAGSGAIFYQQFHLSYSIGICAMAMATLFTFLYSLKGLSFVNTLIVPFLFISMVLIGGFVLFKEGMDFTALEGINILAKRNWMISSITYVGYNMIPSFVILSSIGSAIDNKQNAIKGGFFGGIILGILAIFILVPCLILYKDVSSLEIPMLYVSQSLGSKGGLFYGIILWCAMFTTAIGNGFGFIKRISSSFPINYKLTCILFSFLSIPFATFGFSNLIMLIYPIFGYIGFLIISFALLKFLFRKIN